MPLSFVHLNIERDRHLDRIGPFLKERMPDVVCLQELLLEDVPHLESLLGARCFFVPMMYVQHPRGRVTEGVGIFSRFPIAATSEHWIGGKEGELVDYIDTVPEEKLLTQRYVIAIVDIEKDGETYRIATTHFPVTVGGSESDIQNGVLDRFLEVTATLEEFVVTGDFNAPRGGPAFSRLCERYTDNVPSAYMMSLDLTLHRAGAKLPADIAKLGLPGLMVDGVFSTVGYRVVDVEMICGVSDHCALVGSIEKQ
ncbi:MAG: hypothetical protein AB199_01400 [Parcubacteria bacterium C7867-004]|nr:MAG: hypothetical protein AB199_01400 [Parcubacteria bacterium C7867-004]